MIQTCLFYLRNKSVVFNFATRKKMTEDKYYLIPFEDYRCRGWGVPSTLFEDIAPFRDGKPVWQEGCYWDEIVPLLDGVAVRVRTRDHVDLGLQFFPSFDMNKIIKSTRPIPLGYNIDVTMRADPVDVKRYLQFFLPQTE